MSLHFSGFRREVLMLSRFALVGCFATAVHMSVSLFLVHFFGMTVQWANLSGFAAALGVSYFGHYNFSFQSTREHRVAVARFLVVAGGSFACNLLLVEFLTAQTSLGDGLRLVLGIGVMPIASFIISRLWVY